MSGVRDTSPLILILILIFLSFTLPLRVPSRNDTGAARLLSLFSVVKFTNTECEANNTFGVCVTSKEVGGEIIKLEKAY